MKLLGSWQARGSYTSTVHGDAQYFAVGFFKQQLERKTCPVLTAVNEIFGCLVPGNNVCSWILFYGFSTFRQATWAQISLDLDEICSMQT